MKRFRFLLILSLLSTLLTPLARADQIVFSKFKVLACKELGKCNWLVHIRFGYGNDGDWNWICPDPLPEPYGCNKTGPSSFEVDSGHTVYFDGPHVFPIESYPVKMTVFVQEIDGFLDTGDDRDYVGSDMYTIDGPGEYFAWFDNDEGEVEVHWDVVPSTGTSQSGLQIGEVPQTYLGILESGADEHGFSGSFDGSGLSYEQFSQSFDAQVQSGKRLVDVETFHSEEDGRRYIGAYREGSGPYLWTPGVDWEQFVEYWEIFSEGGLRLVDFDTYVEGDVRLYSGSFVEGNDAHALVISDWDGLVAAWEEKSAQGLRLVDIEAYRTGNAWTFAGVFRAGNDGYALWVSEWDAFFETWENLTAAGLQLIDVETYRVAGTRQYIGVYGVATSGHVLLAGHEWEEFFDQYAEYAAKGYRLADVEIYEGAVDAARTAEKPFERQRERPTGTLRRPLLWNELDEIRRSSALPAVFLRGDANVDGTVNISDALTLFGFLFSRQETPHCMDAADANDDGAVNISDSLSILQFLFSANGSLPAPGTESCGVPEPAEDRRGLGCGEYGACAGESGGGRVDSPADARETVREESPARGSLPRDFPLPPLLWPEEPDRTPEDNPRDPRG